jgi:hypothetical protein
VRAERVELALRDRADVARHRGFPELLADLRAVADGDGEQPRPLGHGKTAHRQDGGVTERVVVGVHPVPRVEGDDRRGRALADHLPDPFGHLLGVLELDALVAQAQHVQLRSEDATRLVEFQQANVAQRLTVGERGTAHPPAHVAVGAADVRHRHACVSATRDGAAGRERFVVGMGQDHHQRALGGRLEHAVR